MPKSSFKINTKPSLNEHGRPPPRALTKSASRRPLSLILARLAEAHKIGGDDRFGRLRGYAETAQNPSLGLGLGRYDIVEGEQFDLIASRRQKLRKPAESRLAREGGHRRDRAGRHERQADEKPAALHRSEDEFGRLTQRRHLRSAEFVNRSRARFACERSGRRTRDVAAIDRLQARLSAGEQRNDRHDARERAKPVEEVVLRSEHDGRAKDRRARE